MSDDGVTSGPIDVGAVRRDDAFLDDLAAGRAADVADGAEHELAGLIAQWRADSISSPIPTTPTVSDIEAAIARANQRERRGGLSRRLRIVSGAAAILAVVGAGLLVMSEGSQPGDPLWSVKQVVFSDQAHQTQARMNAEDNIAAAKEAFAAGDVVKANQLIKKAEDDIRPMRDKDEAADLRELIQDIRDKNPGKVLPSLPSLPSLPNLPLPTDDEKPNPTVMLQTKSPTSSTTKAPTSTSQTSSTKETKPSTPTTTSTTPTASGSKTAVPTSSTVD